MESEFVPSEELISILKDNAQLLQQNNFKEIYENLSPPLSGEFTSMCYLSEINPLQFMTEVPASMFSYVELPKVIVPAHIKVVKERAFNSSRIQEVILPTGATLEPYSFGLSYINHIQLPQTLSTIPELCFKGSDIQEINIPAPVASIGGEAFNMCHHLQKVVFEGDKIQRIGPSAFSSCTRLQEIVYPGTKEQWNAIKIGKNNDPLYQCRIICADQEIVPIGVQFSRPFLKLISQNQHLIDGNRFDELYDIFEKRSKAFEEVPVLTLYLYHLGLDPIKHLSTIPGSFLREVDINLFPFLQHLKNLSLPKNITGVRLSAFRGCKGIETADLSQSIETVDTDAFYYCKDLKNLTLSNSINQIGSNAFATGGLLTVKYEGTVEDWRKIKFGTNPWPFTKEEQIVLCLNGEVTITDAYSKTIQRLLKKYSKEVENGDLTVLFQQFDVNVPVVALTSFLENAGVDILGHLTRIPSDFCRDRADIVEVKLPEGVVDISYNAYKNCDNLTTVQIPNSVKWILDGSFSQCSKLQSVTIGQGLAHIADGAFEQTPLLKEILFAGTKDQWKKAATEKQSYPPYLVKCSDGTLKYDNMLNWVEI